MDCRRQIVGIVKEMASFRKYLGFYFSDFSKLVLDKMTEYCQRRGVIRGLEADFVAYHYLPSFGFEDLHIDAEVVAGANDAQQCADGFGSLPFFTDNAAHIVFCDFEGQEYPEIVDGAGDLYFGGNGNDRFDDVLKEVFIDGGFHGGRVRILNLES